MGLGFVRQNFYELAIVEGLVCQFEALEVGLLHLRKLVFERGGYLRNFVGNILLSRVLLC